MILKHLVVGALQCNCSILACEKSGEAMVIDPGDNPEQISQILKDFNLKPKYLLHTHAHFDHLGATHSLHQKFQSSIALHRGDQALYENVSIQTRLFGFPNIQTSPVTDWIEDKQVLKIGEISLEVLHTPGHSPGSVSFYLKEAEEEVLFTGDTLFMQGIGRTDLWGGNHEQLLRSIHNKLLSFPESTRVIPGHGPETSIGSEKDGNPFLRNF